MNNLKSVGKTMKSIMTAAYLLVVMFGVIGVCGITAFADEAQHVHDFSKSTTCQCGAVQLSENMVYKLDSESGELTISGTGAMKNWTASSDKSPWYGSQDIKNVVIESGITSIGDYAFAGCNQLEKVTIDDSVTSIGEAAFSGCIIINEITISNYIQSIDSLAFENCSALTEVIVPCNVKTIGNEIFKGCTNLTSIYAVEKTEVYDSLKEKYTTKVKYVSEKASHSLADDKCSICGESYSVDSGNCGAPSHESDVSWELFTDGKLVVSGTGAMANWDNVSNKSPWNGLTTIKDVVIESGVTNVGDYAFYGCTNLSNAKMANSVTNVGDYAFANCTGLTNVEIPNSDASAGKVTVSSDAFAGSTAVTSFKKGCQVACTYEGGSVENTVLHNYVACDDKINHKCAFCDMSPVAHESDGTCVCGHEIGAIVNKDYETSYVYSGSAISSPTAANWTFNNAGATLKYDWYEGSGVNDEKKLQVEPKNVGTYLLVVTAEGNKDYSEATCNVEISITKATPSVVTPTAAGVTYGQTLKDARLSDTKWSWVDNTVIPTVGNSGYSAQTTVDDSNYNYEGIEGYSASTHTVTRTIAVNVQKARPTITQVSCKNEEVNTSTAISDIVLEGTAQYNGKMVPGIFKLKSTVTKLLTTQTRYACVFTPTDTTNYDSVDGSVTFTVKRVQSNLDRLQVEGLLEKRKYTYGEDFSLKGAIVKAIYENGDIMNVTDKVEYDKGLTVGQTKVELSYTEDSITKTCQIDGLTVTKANPNIVEVKSTVSPLYTSMRISSVQLTGTAKLQKVEVPGTFKLKDTVTALVPTQEEYAYIFTPEDTDNLNSVEGIVKLTVVQADELDKLELEGKLEKSVFSYGDEFSLTGLKVNAVYKDGSKKDVTDLVSFNKELVMGQKKVTLSYKEKEITKTCDVDGLKVEKATPVLSKIRCVEGNSFYEDTKVNSLTIEGVATVGEKTIEGSFSFKNTVTAFSVDKSEYACVFTPKDTTNYNTAEGTVVLTIVESRVLESIEATGVLRKKTYVYGEAFELNGVIVKAVFSDGQKEDITKKVEYDKVLEVGQEKVTLSYTVADVTQSCDVKGITVKKATPVITSDVMCKNDGIIYDSMDVKDLKLEGEATVDDDVIDGKFVLKDAALNVMKSEYACMFIPNDEKHYNQVSGTVKISVVENRLEKLQVTGALDKKDYIYGEDFSLKGINVEAIYTSGMKEDVTDSVEYNKQLVAGQTVVGVSFKKNNVSKTVDITDITVKKAIPTYVVPTGMKATCGQKLVDVRLKDSHFSWEEGKNILIAQEDKQEMTNVDAMVTYTPEDTKNYEIVENIPVVVTVSHDLKLQHIENTDRHGFYCSGCGTSFKLKECEGGKATCMKKARCIVCNGEYGDLDEDNHSFEETWSYNGIYHYYAASCEHKSKTKEKAKHVFVEVIDKPATTISYGKKHDECEVCGYKKETVLIPVIGSEEPIKSRDPQLGEQIIDENAKATYTVTNPGKREVAYVSSNKSGEKSVKIPSVIMVDNITYKVTKIANGAFKNNKKIKSVTIGKNVKSIGKDAFYQCSALKKVTIPSNVSKIGAGAFEGCSRLKTVSIKTKKLSAKRVGAKAFAGIHAKAKINVPASKYKSYKKWLKKRGITGKSQKIK